MKKTFKRIFSAILALSIICSISIPVFANDINSTNSPVSSRGIWGGEATASEWGGGTFNVYLPKKLLSAGMTLKTTCSNPNSQGGVFFYVYDPNGRLLTYDEILGPTDEDNTLKIFNAPAGNYKVEYVLKGTPGTIKMNCWIYG